jgi:hypothetical protein
MFKRFNLYILKEASQRSGRGNEKQRSLRCVVGRRFGQNLHVVRDVRNLKNDSTKIEL